MCVSLQEPWGTTGTERGERKSSRTERESERERRGTEEEIDGLLSSPMPKFNS